MKIYKTKRTNLILFIAISIMMHSFLVAWLVAKSNDNHKNIAHNVIKVKLVKASSKKKKHLPRKQKKQTVAKITSTNNSGNNKKKLASLQKKKTEKKTIKKTKIKQKKIAKTHKNKQADINSIFSKHLGGKSHQAKNSSKSIAINKLANIYGAKIKAQIDSVFEVPAILHNSQKNLQASIKIKISAKGSVISKTLYRSSGNYAYDNAILLAIDKASLAHPPKKLIRDLLTEGIVLIFTP